MLPPIPQKLRKIDDSTVGEHFWLDGADRCYYIWEYAARKRYDFSPANQLVFNLKIKPSAVAKTPARNRYKLEAIGHAGSALRSLVTREFVEARATFVPIPCSKAVADPVVDDVLNSGKHFKVAQSFIKARYANAEVRGLFLSRCVREPVESGAPPD